MVSWGVFKNWQQQTFVDNGSLANKIFPKVNVGIVMDFLNFFLSPSCHKALCSLLRRDASINFKAKGNSLVSVLACNLLMAAYEEDENWPEIFVKVRISQSKQFYKVL